MDEKDEAHKQFHIETGKNIAQCNTMMRTVFDILQDPTIPQFQLPMGPDEAAAISQELEKFKVKYRRRKVYIDRIIGEAASLGYTGDDIDGAVQFISKNISNGSKQSAEMEALRRVITDMTSTSDQRKRQSKVYVEKLKAKLRKAHEVVETLRQVQIELINMHIGASYDADLLRRNLTQEESTVLGLAPTDT